MFQLEQRYGFSPKRICHITQNGVGMPGYTRVDRDNLPDDARSILAVISRADGNI
jgi:hypothetical protein